MSRIFIGKKKQREREKGRETLRKKDEDEENAWASLIRNGATRGGLSTCESARCVNKNVHGRRCRKRKASKGKRARNEIL